MGPISFFLWELCRTSFGHSDRKDQSSSSGKVPYSVLSVFLTK